MDLQTLKKGLIPFGRVVGAHGLRGGVRVRPIDPQSGPVRLAHLYLERNGEPIALEIRTCARAGRGTFKFEFRGIDTLEQAEQLRGAEVYLSMNDLPAPADNEFYYFQVVGLRVETISGEPVGTIDEVFFNGANDVWVVKGDFVGELLIPVIEDVVRRIDVEGGRAIIHPIPGLLS